MSTHNIGFYEDLTKIIFELSSNIIKYAPYFFCCRYHTFHVMRLKPNLLRHQVAIFIFNKLKSCPLQILFQIDQDLFTMEVIFKLSY